VYSHLTKESWLLIQNKLSLGQQLRALAMVAQEHSLVHDMFSQLDIVFTTILLNVGTVILIYGGPKTVTLTAENFTSGH